jgi:hypothetical protein
MEGEGHGQFQDGRPWENLARIQTRYLLNIEQLLQSCINLPNILHYHKASEKNKNLIVYFNN